MSGTHAVFRVERGRATDAELAALAVVLSALLAAPDDGADTEHEPGVPSWRPERTPAAYRSPYCWR